MTRALVTQLLEALELHAKQYPHMQKGYTVDAITAARAYLATEPKPTLKEALTQQGIKLRTEFEPKQRDSELATEPSGERAELIKKLRWASVVSGNETCGRAADMLEADAQQAKSKDAELIAIYAKLAEAELRSNQLESQFKSQCRITASALDERAQQAKRVPLKDNEIAMIAQLTQSAEPGNDGYILPFTFARAIEAHHGITPK